MIFPMGDLCKSLARIWTSSCGQPCKMGNHKYEFCYGNEDEIELEKSESEKKLNKEFKHYAEKVTEALSI